MSIEQYINNLVLAPPLQGNSLLSGLSDGTRTRRRTEAVSNITIGMPDSLSAATGSRLGTEVLRSLTFGTSDSFSGVLGSLLGTDTTGNVTIGSSDSLPDATRSPPGTGIVDNVTPPAPSPPPANLTAAVNANTLLSFVEGVLPQEKDDVLYSIQLAVRGATGKFDRFTQTQAWYQKYTEVLENLGWSSEQFAFTRYDEIDGELRMDQAALAVIAAIATQNQLTILTESIRALERLAEGDRTICLFDSHTSTATNGNFQIGAVQRANNGALSLALGAFHFRSRDTRRRFLFFGWGAEQVNFWTAAQKLTLNTGFYAPLREAVQNKLGIVARDYISALSV